MLRRPLIYVEAAHREASAFVQAARCGTWYEAHERGKRGARWTGREPDGLDHEAWPQRQPPIESPPCNIHPAIMDCVRCRITNRAAPPGIKAMRPRRQQAQARPRGRDDREHCQRQIGRRCPRARARALGNLSRAKPGSVPYCENPTPPGSLMPGARSRLHLTSVPDPHSSEVLALPGRPRFSGRWPC